MLGGVRLFSCPSSSPRETLCLPVLVGFALRRATRTHSIVLEVSFGLLMFSRLSALDNPSTIFSWNLSLSLFLGGVLFLFFFSM